MYDKTGILAFARQLVDLGYEIVSTGGSARHLVNGGISVTSVEDVTGFPEILGGRVKTLHPNIHGGLLARMDQPDHVETLTAHGIVPIDILVSNLYPFAAAVADASLGDAAKIEEIDIGGPAMVRAAAKNFASVLVVTDPGDYDEVTTRLKGGQADHAYRRALAARAFGHVSTYDSLVAAFLRNGEPEFPDDLSLGFRRVAGLRYGENPQQRAASYRPLAPAARPGGLLDAVQLHGKELSFNNLLDGDAALAASRLSPEPTVAIVKHTVPCGAASRPVLAEAFQAALDGDPVSAFGGIVAANRPIDEESAQRMSAVFFEVIIAPEFTPGALAVLTRKRAIRLLQLPDSAWMTPTSAHLDLKPITGGMLVQTADTLEDKPSQWTVATRTEPSGSQLRDLDFAWRAVRLVKSNAIVFVRDTAIVGVGAGQPNRLESVNLAAQKAGTKARGAVMASDAFFPFADGVERALEAGISAIVQPGGSVRDAEVIAAADAAGIPMLFTGTRHFRH